MKKWIVFCLGIVILSSFVSAEITGSTKLYSGESYQFEDYDIYLLLGADEDAIMFRIGTDTEFLRISDGTYEDDATFDSSRYNGSNMVANRSAIVRYGDLKISLTKVCFDLNEGDCGRIAAGDTNIEPSFELEFELRESAIEVTTTYDKERAWPGEEVLVEVEVINDGDVAITDFKYVEKYPEAVEILSGSSEGFKVYSDHVEKTISYIPAGKTERFRYRISLLDKLSYGLRGEYFYKYEEKYFSDFSNEVELEFVEVLNIEIDAPDTMLRSDYGDVVVKIGNNIDERTQFNFYLDIPHGFTIGPGINDFKEIDEGRYYVGEELNIGEEVEYEIVLKSGEVAGDYDLLGSYDFSNNDYGSLVKQKQEVTVLPEDIRNIDGFLGKLNLRFSDVLEGERLKLEVHLVAGLDTELSNIKINVSDSLDTNFYFNGDFIDFIDKYEYFRNYYYDFKAVDVETIEYDEISVNISADVTYPNGTKVFKDEIVDVDLNIYDFDSSIVVEREFEPADMVQGETATVKVYLENKIEGRSFNGVVVNETIPEDYVYDAYTLERVVDLYPNKKAQVYSYVLRAPYYVDVGAGDVKTRMVLDNLTVTNYYSFAAKVNIDEPLLTVETELPDEIVAGEGFRANITVTNSGEIEAKNILVNFPIFENFDLMVDELHGIFEVVSNLDEEEYVKYSAVYYPKLGGNDSSIYEFEFFDVFGNKFLKNISTPKVVVQSAGHIDCIVTAKKIFSGVLDNGTYVGSKVPIGLVFRNDCDDVANVDVYKENIDFEIPAQGSKRILLEREIEGNFTGELASHYAYSYGSGYRVSKSNDLIIEVEMIADEEEEVQVGTGSGVEQGFERPISIDTTESFTAEYAGFFAIIVVFIVVFVVVLYLFSYVKAKQKQILEEKELKEKSYDDELVSPSLVDGVEALDSFIAKSRRIGKKEIEIEHELSNRGWPKDIIDSFMRFRK